jgi:DNA ligase-1
MLRCNWTLRAGLPARYSPMLASPLTVTASSKKLSRRAKAEGPFYVSPKLDGIRVVYTAAGAFTRRGQQIHGLKTIAPILAPLFKADPTLVLDGELYSTQVAQEPGGFENIMSLISKLRRERPKGVEKQLDTLAFHVFDVLQMNKNADRKTSKVLLNNTPFAVRFAALRTLFASPALKRGLPHVRRVPHALAHDLSGARLLLRRYLAMGVEGAVIRTHDNVYQPGVRSNSMIKLVPWHDSEFRVIRFVPASTTSGHRRGSSSHESAIKKKTGKHPVNGQSVIRMVECVTRHGLVFHAHVGVPADVARNWLQRSQEENLTGVYATVRYPRATNRGVPRFGVVKGLRGKAGRWFL